MEISQAKKQTREKEEGGKGNTGGDQLKRREETSKHTPSCRKHLKNVQYFVQLAYLHTLSHSLSHSQIANTIYRRTQNQMLKIKRQQQRIKWKSEGFYYYIPEIFFSLCLLEQHRNIILSDHFNSYDASLIEAKMLVCLLLGFEELRVEKAINERWVL